MFNNYHSHASLNTVTPCDSAKYATLQGGISSTICTEFVRKELVKMIRYTSAVSMILLYLASMFSVSLATTAYWKNKMARNSAQNSFYNFQKKDIQSELDMQNSLESKLMDAMAWVMSDRIVGQEQCKNGVFASRFATKSASLKLEGVSYEMEGVFNNTINENLSKFRSLADVSKVNPCSKEGEAVSKELTISQRKIQFMILDSISALEKQKETIENKINSINESII